MKYVDLETLTNSSKSLIVFEKKTIQLYRDIAEKTEHLPLVKSMLFQLAIDSQKHATILKGIVQSLPKTSWKPNELPKTIANAWRSIDDFQMDLSDIDELPKDELIDLAEQLSNLEKIMCEAYDVLVQFGNLEIISRELDKTYRSTFDMLKTVYMEIIHDEEYHKEILGTIVQLLKREEKRVQSAPQVRFQNPDAWNRVSPINV